MSQDRDISSLIINQTFKIYKSNSSLSSSIKLTKKQLEKFRITLCKYLYQRYQQTLQVEDDLLVQYESYRDIVPELTIYNNSIEEHSQYKIQYLIIKCANNRLISRQVFIFVSNDDNFTLVLNRITNHPSINEYILELLEDINDYPLIIKPLDLPDYLIPNLVDQLGNKLDSLGDLQLVYSSPTSNRLRNFIIDIPKNDLPKLSGDGKLYQDIVKFMYNNTKIKFEKLRIEKFINNLINIASDGKFKLIINDNQLIWFLIESIKSSLQ